MASNKLCKITSFEITWKAECAQQPDTDLSFCLNVVLFEKSEMTVFKEAYGSDFPKFNIRRKFPNFYPINLTTRKST